MPVHTNITWTTSAHKNHHFQKVLDKLQNITRTMYSSSSKGNTSTPHT